MAGVPSEVEMYDSLFSWVRKTKPELKTVFAALKKQTQTPDPK